MTYNLPLGYMRSNNNVTNYRSDQPAAGIGLQVQLLKRATLPLQVLFKFYNDFALRILYDFGNRGLTGETWTNADTETGYDVNDLNNDIVENIWRTEDDINSTALYLDSEYPQGILVDTLCILNHNLTQNATITWESSPNPSFLVEVETIELEITPNNIYWIAPTLPNYQHRYHRFFINDSGKVLSTDYISIGTILMGNSFVMHNEDIVDRITFGHKEFADKVETEGYDNITNSRALKRNIIVDFMSINYTGPNYSVLNNIFTTYRTSLKTMWIPTPSSTDQTLTDRFAVFGKMASMPSQTHNYKGPNEQYIDFTVEVDESL